MRQWRWCVEKRVKSFFFLFVLRNPQRRSPSCSRCFLTWTWSKWSSSVWGSVMSNSRRWEHVILCLLHPFTLPSWILEIYMYTNTFKNFWKKNKNKIRMKNFLTVYSTLTQHKDEISKLRWDRIVHLCAPRLDLFLKVFLQLLFSSLINLLIFFSIH